MNTSQSSFIENSLLKQQLLEEASKVLNNYQQMKDEIDLLRKNKEELQKILVLHEKTIKQLLIKNNDEKMTMQDEITEIKKDKFEALKRLYDEMDKKDRIIDNQERLIKKLLSEKEALYNDLGEKDEEIKKMRQIKNLYSNATNDVPIDDQVLFLFSGDYPEDERLRDLSMIPPSTSIPISRKELRHKQLSQNSKKPSTASQFPSAPLQFVPAIGEESMFSLLSNNNIVLNTAETSKKANLYPITDPGGAVAADYLARQKAQFFLAGQNVNQSAFSLIEGRNGSPQKGSLMRGLPNGSLHRSGTTAITSDFKMPLPSSLKAHLSPESSFGDANLKRTSIIENILHHEDGTAVAEHSTTPELENDEDQDYNFNVLRNSGVSSNYPSYFPVENQNVASSLTSIGSGNQYKLQQQKNIQKLHPRKKISRGAASHSGGSTSSIGRITLQKEGSNSNVLQIKEREKDTEITDWDNSDLEPSPDPIKMQAKSTTPVFPALIRPNSKFGKKEGETVLKKLKDFIQQERDREKDFGSILEKNDDFQN